MRIAVLDDWQNIARKVADWAPLRNRAELVFFNEALGDEARTAAAL